MNQQSKLPRVLWLFWSQGAKQAPMVVKKCLRSWIDKNPSWRIVLLDRQKIGQYIKVHSLCKEPTHIRMAHQSDLMRLQLLYKYGGVWADATSFCVKPLDEWVDEATQSGFFAFSRPAADRIISNWFLSSHENNPITGSLLKLLIKYFQANKEYPYFIFHQIYEQLIKDNKQAAAIWAKTPKISAVPPHLLFHAGLLNPIDDQLKSLVKTSDSPVFKLSWKFDESLYNEHCVLHYLFEEFANKGQP